LVSENQYILVSIELAENSDGEGQTAQCEWALLFISTGRGREGGLLMARHKALLRVIL
jgi:hypothetical protein